MTRLFIIVALLITTATDADARRRKRMSTTTAVIGTMILLGHDSEGRPIYANCGPHGTLQVNGMCCLLGTTLDTEGWCVPR